MPRQSSQTQSRTVLAARIGAFTALATSIAVLLPGCPHDVYQIDLRPQGQRIERTITIGHVEDTGQPLTNVTTTRGEFASSLPDDVGGSSGYYVHLTSDLGAASIYGQRFRGHDDQATVIERQFRAADRVNDLFIGWLKTELGTTAQFEKIRAFLDTDGRADLKNLVLHVWMLDAVGRSVATQPEGPRDAAAGSVFARALLYLADRGYIRAADAPRIARLVWGDDSKNEAIALLRRALESKVGLTDQATLDKAVALAKQLDASARSFGAYIAKSPEYQKANEESKAPPLGVTVTTKPSASDLDPVNWAFEPLTESLNLFGGGDEFRVTLHVSAKPTWTNGQYDARSGLIAWSFLHQKEKATLPEVCFAQWVQPTVAAQKAHFGKVVLDGDDLSRYCLWYQSLSPGESARWAKMMAKVKPGCDYRKVFAEFAPPDENQPEGIRVLERLVPSGEPTPPGRFGS